ncbi:MAG: hypothetical protein NW203_07760 [Hyphomonadaceae bacterium]|nr:hypothetical protein [Hyphomonadaceae bacterium]
MGARPPPGWTDDPARDAGPARRAPRRLRRLDPRFAAYLVGQITPAPAPDAGLTVARYRAAARDLSRPRAGALTDERV